MKISELKVGRRVRITKNLTALRRICIRNGYEYVVAGRVGRITGFTGQRPRRADVNVGPGFNYPARLLTRV